MMGKWMRITGADTLSAVLVLAVGMSATAGTRSGERACGSSSLVSLYSETHSVLNHTHRYTSASDSIAFRNAPSARLSWSSVGPNQQANWYISNNSAEALKEGYSWCPPFG